MTVVFGQFEIGTHVGLWRFFKDRRPFDVSSRLCGEYRQNGDIRQNYLGEQRSTPKQLRAALRLAAAAGLPVKLVRKTPSNWRSWDGNTLRVLGPSDLCHEIAHWCVATRSRRSAPDYGLGHAPGTHPDCCPNYLSAESCPGRQLSSFACEDEEDLASLLGIVFECVLRLPWRFTLEKHTWLDRDMVCDTFDDLQTAGFVDANGWPLGKIRT